MLLTFGSVSSLTILLVMIVAIVASVSTGNAVKEKATPRVDEWVQEFVSSTSRYVAQALSPKIMPNDMINIMVEVAQDRFAGYPTTEDDSLTPFFDTLSQTNAYPIKNEPLPLDWDFRHTLNEEGNVDNETFAEHVQSRWSKGYFVTNPRLSTVHATYTFRGTCDPRANDGDMTYIDNCTDANNDINTGGVIAPTPTNKLVHRKASDLSPFMKTLFESQYDIRQLGYYFSNGGAGASSFFPHYELNSANSYVSIGCEWMRAQNPIDPSLGPIASDEEIARCHPEGTVVNTREYNPLERGWCRDQALEPNRNHNVGPFLSAWTEGLWQMVAGRAIYDRVTNRFIACIAIDFTMDIVENVLNEVKVDEIGTLTLVRNDANGSVVMSPNVDWDNAEELTQLVNDNTLQAGVNERIFNHVKSTDWYTTDGSVFETEEFILSVYPIPSAPEPYDPTYRPEFYAIFTVPKTAGIFQKANEIGQEVDERVSDLILFTVLVGLAGIVVVVLLILAAASWFVEPLLWMKKIGDKVVGKFGQEDESGIDYERKKTDSCAPKTELNTLAEEFSRMVRQFSGEGTAKRVHISQEPILNTFDFSLDFAGLYQSRDKGSFKFNYPKAASENASKDTDDEHIHRCNFGKITRPPRASIAASTSSTQGVETKVHKTTLFIWMVVLIATPMLAINLIISGVVLGKISISLPSVTLPVGNEFSELRKAYRIMKTKTLAKQMSNIAEKAARDTHILNRMASWLYFGAIDIPDVFTEVMEGTEDCKNTPSGSECEWKRNVACDCEWNDFSARGKTDACTNYSPGESRYLQKVFFATLSEDAGPDGSQYLTSYPEVATSPNTTAWWDNITVLPNGDRGSLRTQYSTSYDRVNILSSLSAVFIPLFNYDKSNDKPVAMYIGLDADGTMAGFKGCDSGFANYAFWQSSNGNGAAKLRPELCPVGKHGYDARCRGWYHDGKIKSMESNESIHVTAPYIFAGGTLGQSMTAPLVGPDGTHIGQVLVDFLPGPMLKAVNNRNKNGLSSQITVMVTTDENVMGHDTVIGPGFSLDQADEGKSIKDLISTDGGFASILHSMKDGEIGDGTFGASIGGASEEEEYHVSYAPVNIRSFRPLDSSDIARGIEERNSTVFSLAFIDAMKSNAVSKAFKEIEDYSSRTVDICIGVLASLLVVSTLLIVYIAFRVAASMSKPILLLLGVMKEMNNMNSVSPSNNAFADMSDYKGSCREVDSVYKTMEMLYKVVQFANVAYFSGQMDVAFKVLKDALRMFVRLDNKKAIAVASNNLGNTMLTVYRTMKSGGFEQMCGLSISEVIEKGTAYYAHSIKLGEEAYDKFYDEQGWSEECLVFMQHLANRYFNRAVFLLTTSRDQKEPKKAESLGFRDLQITGDMDCEIVDQCLEMGFKINRVERFELMMSRVRGLLALEKLGFSPEELFIEDQINNLFHDLTKAMKDPSNELFEDVAKPGRMQQFDTELIKYFRDAKGDNVNAARVAIRMLIEDEYVFPDAGQEAIKTILVYLESSDEYCPEDEDGLIEKELTDETLELDKSISEEARRRTSFLRSSGVGDSLKNSMMSPSTQNILGESLTNLEGPVGGLEENGETGKSKKRIALLESGKMDVTMELF